MLDKILKGMNAILEIKYKVGDYIQKDFRIPRNPIESGSERKNVEGAINQHQENVFSFHLEKVRESLSTAKGFSLQK